mmetsp:Transcript_14864/g.35934  ORF Transcript_14864/g.35934 Transcript_14864/m.35934 type:complete len:302 (+) Transcript_14864:274-1179(+)
MSHEVSASSSWICAPAFPITNPISFGCTDTFSDTISNACRAASPCSRLCAIMTTVPSSLQFTEYTPDIVCALRMLMPFWPIRRPSSDGSTLKVIETPVLMFVCIDDTWVWRVVARWATLASIGTRVRCMLISGRTVSSAWSSPSATRVFPLGASDSTKRSASFASLKSESCVDRMSFAEMLLGTGKLTRRIASVCECPNAGRSRSYSTTSRLSVVPLSGKVITKKSPLRWKTVPSHQLSGSPSSANDTSTLSPSLGLKSTTSPMGRRRTRTASTHSDSVSPTYLMKNFLPASSMSRRDALK